MHECLSVSIHTHTHGLTWAHQGWVKPSCIILILFFSYFSSLLTVSSLTHSLHCTELRLCNRLSGFLTAHAAGARAAEGKTQPGAGEGWQARDVIGCKLIQECTENQWERSLSEAPVCVCVKAAAPSAHICWPGWGDKSQSSPTDSSQLHRSV